MASLRTSCRGAITIGCLVIAAAACAVSMVACRWLLDGTPTSLIAQTRHERDQMGAVLNQTQQLLTRTQAQLYALQTLPEPAPPVCVDHWQVQRREEPRPLPVLASEWTIR
jgi:hypothetical protein